MTRDGGVKVPTLFLSNSGTQTLGIGKLTEISVVKIKQREKPACKTEIIEDCVEFRGT